MPQAPGDRRHRRRVGRREGPVDDPVAGADLDGHALTARRTLQQPGAGSQKYSSSVSPASRGRCCSVQCQLSCSTQLRRPSEIAHHPTVANGSDNSVGSGRPYDGPMRLLVVSDVIGSLPSRRAGELIASGWTGASDHRGAGRRVGPGLHQRVRRPARSRDPRRDAPGSSGRELPRRGTGGGAGQLDRPNHRLDASSRPLGEAVASVLDGGSVTRLVVDLGGSGVHDGGAGLLAALGATADRPLDQGVAALAGLGRLDLGPGPGTARRGRADRRRPGRPAGSAVARSARHHLDARPRGGVGHRADAGHRRLLGDLRQARRAPSGPTAPGPGPAGDWASPSRPSADG